MFLVQGVYALYVLYLADSTAILDVRFGVVLGVFDPRP